MRNWYTPQELAGLPSMPGTVQGIRKVAQRECWEGQRRIGSKAIEYAFAVLPKETQAALITAAVATSKPEAPGQLHHDLATAPGTPVPS